jgi:hypothetical protein
MSRLLLTLIWVLCLTLATWLAPVFAGFKTTSSGTSALALLMGESRQMFAMHFYAKADAYFHSGNYPTIFDTPQKREQPGHDDDHDHNHATTTQPDSADEEHIKSFLPGAPRDWIERFGRNFIYKGHSHLEDGQEREMLPWLKMATDMDPHQISIYVTTAYWLRDRLHRPEQAEQYLREGLRNNPGSYELYHELGITALALSGDRAKARRLWLIALAKWHAAQTAGAKPDEFPLEQILAHLAQLEKAEGNIAQQISWLEELKKVSPTPESIDTLLREARASLPTNAPTGLH